MSPWDVLGWMLVGAFGLVLVLMTYVTVVMAARIRRDDGE